MTSTERRAPLAPTSTGPEDQAVRPRMTRQRRELLDFLDEQAPFRSAQEIHTGMRAGGSAVGLATVYRNLQVLASAGEVDTLRRPDGEVGYRRCRSSRHHHHLVCRVCGWVLEVGDQPVLEWVRTVSAQAGFSAEDHVLEVSGRCARCTGPGERVQSDR